MQLFSSLKFICIIIDFLTINQATSNLIHYPFHKKIARNLNNLFYFARANHSLERGSNENIYELIRQFFKKGTDL